jgi:hypothetical protein
VLPPVVRALPRATLPERQDHVAPHVASCVADHRILCCPAFPGDDTEESDEVREKKKEIEVVMFSRLG